jgi:hypothetical protein
LLRFQPQDTTKDPGMTRLVTRVDNRKHLLMVNALRHQELRELPLRMVGNDGARGLK